MLKTKWTKRTLAMLTALVMVLTLTSVVALADGATVAFDSGYPTYDEATGKVTVSGTISTANADVTILAIIANETLTLEDVGKMDDAALTNKIVYINQEAANDEGAFNFEFIPRAGVGGSELTVFIGGAAVEEPISETFTVAVAGPVLTIAEPAINIGYGLEISLGTYDGEDSWKASVTEVKVGSTVIASKNIDMTQSGKVVINGLAKGEYTDVTITSSDYGQSKYTGTVTVTAKTLPTLTADKTSYLYGVDSAIVVTASGDNAEDFVTVLKDSGADVAIDTELKTITFDITDTKYKPDELGDNIPFKQEGQVKGYEKCTFVDTVIGSPIKKAMAELSKTVTVTKEADKYTINVPADYVNADGVSISFGADAGKSIEKIRTESAFTHELHPAISVNGYSLYYGKYTIKINALGDDGPNITEEDITIIENGTGVYKKAGAKLVEIAPAEGEIDAATQTLKVGDKAFFYSPVRKIFVGIVTGYADKVAVLADITVEEVASEEIHYGKTQTSYTGTKILMGDYGVAKRIVLTKETAPTDKQLIASDVASGVSDGQILLADYGALKRVVLLKDADVAINAAVNPHYND